MFNIVFYNFNKRPNSTKKPPISLIGRTIPCSMKTVSSVITPVIEITDPKLGNDIPLYNYAYIQDFARYYFIEDIRYDLGVWTLWLRCDVLATYQNDILNSRQYILRSSSDYNPDLIDTLYNTYINSMRNYTEVKYDSDGVYNYDHSSDTWRSYSYFNRSISQGCYCIGVIGNNATGVSYYIMPQVSFQSLLGNLFDAVPSDSGSSSVLEAKTLANYLQYITYCRWFPLLPLDGNLGTMVRTISFGGKDIPVMGPPPGAVDSFCYMVDETMVDHFRITMTLPRHPQNSDYPYMSLAPYSEYSLYFQPFGIIPLDSAKIYRCPRIEVHWYVDYCTGSCELQILGVNNDLDDDPLIYSAGSQIGVNVPVSDMIVDWKLGLGMAALSWIKSGTEKISGGQPLSAFGNAHRNMNDVRAAIESAPEGNVSLIDTVMNTLGTTMGQIVTKGSSDSFLAYNMGRPFIFAYFMEQTAHFDERFGRPCCKNLRLDNLNGFVLCENASVEFVYGNPTVDEQNAAVSMLNSGIFVE